MASALVGACAVGGAEAQTCFTMQAELMHLLQGGGSSYNKRSRYEQAYREQRRVIARTEQRARRAGCFGGGFFLFRREEQGICRTLVPRLRDMQRNLARLDQLRRRPGNDRSYRIRELQTMLRNRGCDLPGRSVFEASPDQRWQWEDDSFYSRRRGTYRTLCVRTCDGYYFPISFSTVPDQFNADARTCQSMCPGAEAELYYHNNPGGGPETMMSLANVPYSSLPTAFQYRKSYDASCSCRPPGGYKVAATQRPQSLPAVAPAESTAPLPRPRPAPGEDPETLANRAGDFVPRVPGEAAEPGSVVVGADGQTVRVVGPVYWGVPEHDDVVIAPVPN